MSTKTQARIPDQITIMLEPAKYGYVTCPHCNGYGSSLKETAVNCTKCGGFGLIHECAEGGVE